MYISYFLHISGELDEAQKEEVERHKLGVRKKEVELAELRQQMVKLSQIVDKQTTEMKELHSEIRWELCTCKRESWAYERGLSNYTKDSDNSNTFKYFFRSYKCFCNKNYNCIAHQGKLNMLPLSMVYPFCM